MRAMSLDLGQGDVWLERVKVETMAREASLAGFDLAVREDALGQLVAQIEQLTDDPSVLAPLAARFSDLKKKLPAQLTEGEEHAEGVPRDRPLLRIDEVDYIAGLLPEVKELLLARLGEGEGS
jgi:hypothetical protein